jgi:hypothetical protein
MLQPPLETLKEILEKQKEQEKSLFSKKEVLFIFKKIKRWLDPFEKEGLLSIKGSSSYRIKVISPFKEEIVIQLIHAKIISYKQKEYARIDIVSKTNIVPTYLRNKKWTYRLDTLKNISYNGAIEKEIDKKEFCKILACLFLEGKD